MVVWGCASMDTFLAAAEKWSDETTAKMLDFFAPEVVAAGGPVTKDWPLTRLDHCLYVLAGYLVIVVIGLINKANAGPAQKKAKKEKLPLAQAIAKEPIKIFQLLYNLVQVLLCGYMIVGTIMEYKRQDYKLICNEFRPKEAGMAYFLWVFYVSKVLDFVDTLFMVVRGNYRQISFLHVYHHITIYLVYWMNVNAGYDGDIYFTVIANGSVHFVMYFYYFLTTLQFKPKWKMLVTLMQLVQFICMNAQAIYILQNGCAFPRRITMMYLFYIISLFVLFMNFFLRSYCKGKGKSKKKQM